MWFPLGSSFFFYDDPRVSARGQAEWSRTILHCSLFVARHIQLAGVNVLFPCWVLAMQCKAKGANVMMTPTVHSPTKKRGTTPDWFNTIYLFIVIILFNNNIIIIISNIVISNNIIYL